MNDQQYQLTVNKGPEPGKVYELISVSITIGRDPMSEITINDPEVSRRHARLIGTLSGYRIQDLGSTNGTFVDGVRLGGEPLDLESGQVISIGGGVVLVYQATVDVDELSVTMLDVDVAFLEPSPMEDQSEIIVDGPIDSEFAAAPVIVSEEDETGDAEIETIVEVDETGDAEIETIVEDELDQEPDDDSLHPATVWDTPHQEEEPSPVNDPATLYEADDSPQPVVIPHEGEPAKPLQADQGSNYRRVSTIVAAILLLVICCCCSLLLFLYYYGGDWLLRQMGLLP